MSGNGLAELLRIADDLRDGAARAPHRVGAMVGEAADAAKVAAKAAAPFKTGHHHDHIKAGMVGPTAAEVYAEADYAGFLEFGTSRMAPRPHIVPAMDRFGVPKLAQSLERIDLL